MNVWNFIRHYILFGWLFDDTPVKEDTPAEYCSDERPYRDTFKYGDRDTYDTVEDDWNCSHNPEVSSSRSDFSYAGSSMSYGGTYSSSDSGSSSSSSDF